MDRLKGKVALISGAARGRRAAESILFANEGARLVIADVLDTEIRALAEEIDPQVLWLLKFLIQTNSLVVSNASGDNLRSWRCRQAEQMYRSPEANPEPALRCCWKIDRAAPSNCRTGAQPELLARVSGVAGNRFALAS